MTNACSNRLVVVGPRRDVASLVSDVRGVDEVLDFERIDASPPDDPNRKPTFEEVVIALERPDLLDLASASSYAW